MQMQMTKSVELVIGFLKCASECHYFLSALSVETIH